MQRACVVSGVFFRAKTWPLKLPHKSGYSWRTAWQCSTHIRIGLCLFALTLSSVSVFAVLSFTTALPRKFLRLQGMPALQTWDQVFQCSTSLFLC